MVEPYDPLHPVGAMMDFNKIPWIPDHLGGSCAMMIFNHQNRSCHPERMSRSPEPFASLKGKRSEGEGSAHRERPFAALRVTTYCRSWSLKSIIAPGRVSPCPWRHECRSYAPRDAVYHTLRKDPPYLLYLIIAPLRNDNDLSNHQ